jgi:flavin reductase (DIM6/NTAB) family NADH-FMN oxidoreductase RutF
MDQIARKVVLRLFTYGLYVVTCRHGEQRNAFTANWRRA